MKFSSGVKHALVDEFGRTAGAGRPVTQARDARSLPRQHRPASRLSVRSRTLALLGLAASAALLGCSSLTMPPWRVEPVYRVAGVEGVAGVAGGSPSAAPGYLALAQKYEGENRVEQALDAYARAAKSAPDSAEVQNRLGLALARHGRIEGAIMALRRAVALAPDRAPLLNNLAYALLLDGRADEASAMFRLTLAVDPAHEIASRNLAHLNQHLPVAAAKAPAPVAATVANDAVVVVAAMPAAAAVNTVAPPVAASTRPEPMPESIAAPPAVASDGPSVTSEAAPLQPRPDHFSIEIMNGNGVGGAAARLRNLLQEQGIHVRRVANLPPYRSVSTQVLYRPGKIEQARLIAQRMPVHADVLAAPAGSTLADLRVVIGHDARRSAGCTALAVCAVVERSAGSGDRTLGRPVSLVDQVALAARLPN